MARRHGPTGHMAMDVSWTAAAGAVAYEVRCGYIYYTTMPACADNVTATSTTITGIDRSKLSESRYYYAAVRAKNSAGASAWTRAYNTSDFPGDITGLTAQRVSGTITLTWTVPDDYNAPSPGTTCCAAPTAKQPGATARDRLSPPRAERAAPTPPPSPSAAATTAQPTTSEYAPWAEPATT